MADTRTQNTKRNITSGFVKQIVSIILPFVTRTLVIHIFGELYQGLSGLFTSILQVLSLADLGFSTAVIYILYKPIADEDNDAICAILAYLKKIYRIVGFVMFGIGVLILPFLDKLISGEIPTDINMYILYVLYLLNTVISYWFFAYRSALLTAKQRNDIVSNIQTVTSVCAKILQIIILLIFKNYYLFVVCNVAATVLNNVFIYVCSKKHFPDLIPRGNISVETKKTLSKQVKAIMIGRVGDVSRNSLDNLFLSAMLGLSVVAAYDNYYYIYSSLYGFMLMLNHAMQASVGNSIAKDGIEKNYNDLHRFSFIIAWISGWCAICMCCLYQPFMHIWMRGNENLIFSNYNMILFCIYFYAINMNNVRNLYISGQGLFWECRYLYIAEAVANIILNWVLGYFFGVAGILWATIITILLFNFIARTMVLFKNYFKFSSKSFYLRHVMYFCVTAIVCVITYFVCSFVTFGGVLGLLLKAMICLVLPNVIFVLIYFKDKQFKNALQIVRKIFSKKQSVR